MGITQVKGKCPVAGCGGTLYPVVAQLFPGYICDGPQRHTFKNDDPSIREPLASGPLVQPNMAVTGGGQKANASEVKVILGMMSQAGILDDLMLGPGHQQAYIDNGWLTQQDINFLMDMRDKAARAGMGLFVSPKQLNRLRDIKDKLVEKGRI